MSKITNTRINPEEVNAIGQTMEGWSPIEILSWASDRYASKLTFATGFGPEGCVLIDLIGRQKLPIDIFTLDTGLLFEETHELWQKLEIKYKLRIRSVKPAQSVDAQAKTDGDLLWNREPDRCCELRKVIPLRKELANVDAWITAIRRDQTEQRRKALTLEWDAKFAIAKINPLVKWTKKDVWSHILKNDVPYNPLHDRDYPSIGCIPCTSKIQPGENDRAGRWRGVVKNECGIHFTETSTTPLSK
jgi:phosphoadenosine phosphosulfate reductase